MKKPNNGQRWENDYLDKSLGKRGNFTPNREDMTPFMNNGAPSVPSEIGTPMFLNRQEMPGMFGMSQHSGFGLGVRGEDRGMNLSQTAAFNQNDNDPLNNSMSDVEQEIFKGRELSQREPLNPSLRMDGDSTLFQVNLAMGPGLSDFPQRNPNAYRGLNSIKYSSQNEANSRVAFSTQQNNANNYGKNNMMMQAEQAMLNNRMLFDNQQRAGLTGSVSSELTLGRKPRPGQRHVSQPVDIMNSDRIILNKFQHGKALPNQYFYSKNKNLSLDRHSHNFHQKLAIGMAVKKENDFEQSRKIFSHEPIRRNQNPKKLKRDFQKVEQNATQNLNLNISAPLGNKEWSQSKLASRGNVNSGSQQNESNLTKKKNRKVPKNPHNNSNQEMANLDSRIKRETKRIKESIERRPRTLTPQLEKQKVSSREPRRRNTYKRETVIDSNTPARWRADIERSMSIQKNQNLDTKDSNQNSQIQLRQSLTPNKSPNLSQNRINSIPKRNPQMTPNFAHKVPQVPNTNNIGNTITSVDQSSKFNVTNSQQMNLNRSNPTTSIHRDREVIMRSKLGMHSNSFGNMMGQMRHMGAMGRFATMGNMPGMGAIGPLGMMRQMGNQAMHMRNRQMMGQMNVNQTQSTHFNHHQTQSQTKKNQKNKNQKSEYPQLTASQERRLKKEMKEKERLKFENERIVNNMNESIEMIGVGQFKKYKRLLGYLINLFVKGDINKEYMGLSLDELQILKIIIYRKFKKHVNINLEPEALAAKLSNMVNKNSLKKNEER